METESLAYKTLRNSSYFFLSYALPIAVAVVVTPFFVNRLGVSEYGIFILVNTITAFLGLLDFGLSTALVKFAAEYNARGDFEALNKLLNSALTMFYLLGIIGLAMYLIIGKWLLPVFNVQAESLQNIFVVFTLAGIVYFINSIASVPGVIVNALQRFDAIAKINIIVLVISNFLYFFVLNFGYQLKAVMAVNVLMSVLSFLFYKRISARELSKLNLRFEWDIGQIKKAYSFGFQTFISNLASSALVYFDRLLIPIFLGPAQLSYYSLPGNVALKAAGVSNSLAPMLMPMASALEGAGETERLQNIYVRAFRSLTIVAAGITLSVILFANKILFFWLGLEFAENGTTILVILAITYYFIGLYIPLQSLLLGLGKLKFLIRLSLTMATINILMLLILVPRVGILGAAWAYLISVLPMVYAFWWVEYRHFNLTNRLNDYLKLYLKLTFTAILTGVVTYFILLPQVNSLFWLLILGPASVLLYFIVYYVFGFADAQDLEILKSFFNRFILKKAKV